MKLAPVPAIPRQPALLGNRFFRARALPHMDMVCAIWHAAAFIKRAALSAARFRFISGAVQAQPQRLSPQQSQQPQPSPLGQPWCRSRCRPATARPLCSPAAVAISENFVLQAPQCAPHTLRSHVLKGMMLYYGFCFAGRDDLGFPRPVRRRTVRRKRHECAGKIV